ncbi:uncharacterized protein LOC124816740 isoform X2 [Hydra vulgaris]|uniref:Uncharacterized protein LOC124816740 isoform X2 n=1 Tax=Hydra vulgaris TaxID=6087 RepID=A0ABM4CZ20_HYDVU
MVFCCIFNCSNRSENCKKSVYRIPKIINHHDKDTELLSTERRANWFAVIKRKDVNCNASHYRVCSDHFCSGKPSKLFEKTHPDWNPTLKMGYKCKSLNSERFIRIKKRQHESGVMKTDKIITTKGCTDMSTESGITITGNNVASDEIDFNVELNNINGPTQIDISAKIIKSLENKLLEKDSLIYQLNKELSPNKIGAMEWFTTNSKVNNNLSF